MTSLASLRLGIAQAYRSDEASVVTGLLEAVPLDTAARARIGRRAGALVTSMRARDRSGGIEQFLAEYRLSTPEGIALLCLAEALLRVPDADTADRLIKDKLGQADWEKHLGQSSSVLVNASTWALMLTGRVLGRDNGVVRSLGDALGKLVARSGEPVIRTALKGAMRILGKQFVLGRTMAEALELARSAETRGYRHSYDMLGEAAYTAADAQRYFDSYAMAIALIGKAAQGRPVEDAPGISVKLSALHPRYEIAQIDRVRAELIPRVLTLAKQAAQLKIGFTIDAEEAERLDLSLDVIEALARAPDLAGWDGFGLAVQAYQKRAMPLLRWLDALAAETGRKLMVRLVKGAYWDSEIKRAQERGLAGYPVFTRKAATDVSYLACAALLLRSPHFYPCFATHNAHTLAAVQELAGDRQDWEFQRLHGMGEALYDGVVGPERACRIYAPVGGHEDLLAYLVRRLLENGANTSFVNLVADPDAPLDRLLQDPIDDIRRAKAQPHPRIPLPRDLFGDGRINSAGLDLSDPLVTVPLLDALQKQWRTKPVAAPIVGGQILDGAERPVFDPADPARLTGTVIEAGPEDVARAVLRCQRVQPDWDAMPVQDRAQMLERAADLLEQDRTQLLALLVREAGKTLPDAIAEVREAVDFCRYYARRARHDFQPVDLPGPTGERNTLCLTGRGIVACISPWNFPLAIFVGQIAATLVAGNAVLAKPAPQTPLIADAAIRLLHRAGIPPDVLHLLPGGTETGQAMIGDPALAGVVFTGSVATAHTINRLLAARAGGIVPLIAETGGQNAMIADSSALPEQVVRDVVVSAFQSAGQRCSACRVLFVQSDIADKLLTMLHGAMEELRLGDPGQLATDIGPVIDEDAYDRLNGHIRSLLAGGGPVHQIALPETCLSGTFIAPTLAEIDRLDRLRGEVFGPVLHVVRYRADQLDAVLDAINATGFGLTLGVHSRINDTIDRIRRRARVGNLYVNRSMIGAVVGVQPFGGEGLSGTGPKAGGPHYLSRLATERVVSVDTTSAGGNAALLTLEEG